MTTVSDQFLPLATERNNVEGQRQSAQSEPNAAFQSLNSCIEKRGHPRRGSWNQGDGLIFVDCDLYAIEPFSTGVSAPSGVHQFLIQPRPQAVQARADPMSGQRAGAFGRLQMLLPEEGAPIGGAATRTMLVAMTPAHLRSRTSDLAVRPRVDLRGRTCMSNFSVTLLSTAHDAGVDMGLCGSQLYFQELRLAIENRLITLFLRCVHGVEQVPEILSPTSARRVLEFIEDKLANNLSLDDLSAVAGLSKFHFARAFRQTIGTSPHAFLMSRRIARALGLLRNRHPVGKVARHCGFSDHAHLTRQFKRSFGFPPSALSGV